MREYDPCRVLPCTRPGSSRTEIGRYLRLTGRCCGNGVISPRAEVVRWRLGGLTTTGPVPEAATAHVDDTCPPDPRQYHGGNIRRSRYVSVRRSSAWRPASFSQLPF